MAIFLGIVIILLVLGVFSPVWAESLSKDPSNKPLSLQDCIKIALETNPLQEAAGKGVQTARETVGESRAPYYPELGVQAGYSRWQQHAFLPSGLSTLPGPGHPSPQSSGRLTIGWPDCGSVTPFSTAANGGPNIVPPWPGRGWPRRKKPG